MKIEDIENLDEITSYAVPPYSFTVDKDKVPEMNLEPPDKDKFFYIEFNIK